MNGDNLSHADVLARWLGWVASVVVLIVSGALAAGEPPSAERAAAESASPIVEASTSSARDVGVGPETADLLRSVAEFRTRIDLLELEIRERKQDTEDADRLFRELEDVLWQHLRRVHAAVDGGAPDFVDQQAALDKLYA